MIFHLVFLSQYSKLRINNFKRGGVISNASPLITEPNGKNNFNLQLFNIHFCVPENINDFFCHPHTYILPEL